MSDLISELFSGNNNSGTIETGTIYEKTGPRKYTVKIGGSLVPATPGTVEGLFVGGRVVLNQTKAGRFIVGNMQDLRQHTVKEIIING